MIEIILIIAFIAYIMSFITKTQQGVLACGLVGFSGKTEFNMDKLRLLLLWNSVERGRDATGIFTPNTGLLKNAEEARKFFNTKEGKEIKADTIFIGHVRAKTSGANTIANAHPFAYGDVVLAHNGTLNKPSTLANKYSLKHNDWSVDSQILAYGVSKNYKDNTEGRIDILSEYEGAAALLYYNKDTECLYAWHDKERPLFRGWDAAGNLYISSIKESLEAAECFAIEGFKENTLFTIKDSQIIKEEEYQTYAQLNPEPVETSGNNQLALPIGSYGQRGFNFQEVKAHYLIGYYVRAKYTTSGGTTTWGETVAKTQKNKWYKVLDASKESNYMVDIRDEEGKVRPQFLSNFDTENYIPVPKEYVMLMAPISSTRTGIQLWEKGDIALVKAVNFKNGDITLQHATLGTFVVDADLLRVVTEDDFADTEFSPENNLRNDEYSHLNDIINNPFHQDEEEEEEDKEDEYIDSTLVRDFINDVDKLVGDLESKYSSGVDVDVTGEINAIKSRLSCGVYNFCSN